MLIDSGALRTLIDLSLDFSEPKKPTNLVQNEERQLALAFLVDIWRQRPDLIQSQQLGIDYAEAIINTLKKGCRDYKSIGVSFSAINLSFYLLGVFTQERNMYAPIIFKAMTFILIDTFVNIELRTEITSQFTSLFRENSSIPIQILCEPLLKQITFEQEK